MFTKEKSKLLLVRPLFFIFVSMILLILCTFFILKSQILGFCVTLALYCGLIIYCCLKNRYILCFAMLAFSIFGSIYLIVDFHIFSNSKLDESIQYEIVGRADEVTNQTSYGYSRILENCTIYLDGEVVAKNKKIKIFISDGNIECGDEITFISKITNYEYFTSTGLTAEASKGIYYSATISYSSILSVNKTPLSVRENIKLHALNILGFNMSEQGAALAYAVIFGDKSYLDFDTRTAFAESGLAHILAVSGLHVTMIFTLLMLLFCKVNIKYKNKFLIVAIVIFIFAYICDFAPSIVRAGIMAITFTSSQLLIKKSDMLNILGFAGVIILSLNPLDIFNVGFVLSFTCMFAMLISVDTSFIFKRVIINKTIFSLVVTSMITSIGTLPCMAFYFGHFSLVNILTNVLLLPIFTLTYAIMFIIVVICLIIPIPFLLSCSDAILLTILDLNKFFTFFQFDYIKILRIGIVGLILSYVLFFVSSQKFNLNHKIKIPLTIFLICCILFSAIFTSTSKLDKNDLIELGGEDNYCIVNNKETILLNSFASATNLKNTKEFLRENSECEIEYIYIFSFDFINMNSIESFSNEFNVENIYITEEAFEKFSIYLEQLNNPSVKILENQNDYYINDIKFTFNDFGQNGYSLDFEFLNEEQIILFTK